LHFSWHTAFKHCSKAMADGLTSHESRCLRGRIRTRCPKGWRLINGFMRLVHQVELHGHSV